MPGTFALALYHIEVSPPGKDVRKAAALAADLRVAGLQHFTWGNPDATLVMDAYSMHIGFAGIEYDSVKALANFRKHGVGFAHAGQALRDPNAMTIEDPDAEGEPRFVTMGMDAAGRVLVMVWTPRGSNVRVISARKASRQEIHFYAQ